MTILSFIAAALMLIQVALMAADWLFNWWFALAIWRRMSPVERVVGHVSFAQSEYWRRELLIGRLSWTFYFLARWYQIMPAGIIYLLRRKGVRRE